MEKLTKRKVFAVNLMKAQVSGNAYLTEEGKLLLEKWAGGVTHEQKDKVSRV